MVTGTEVRTPGGGSTAQAMEAAICHHRAGRLAQAEVIYRQILSERPDHADALHLLGVVAHQNGRADLALDLISRSIALVPDDPARHCNLGEAYRALGRFDMAVAACSRAIQLKPDHAGAFNNLGNALTEQEKFHQAVAAFNRAVELNPDFAEAHSNLAGTLAAEGNLDEALVACARAIALKPDHALAHNILGTVLIRQGRFSEAGAALERAIRLCPTLAPAWCNLAMTLEQEKPDQAAAAYMRAIQYKPTFAQAHFGLGNVLMKQRKFEAGAAAYAKTVEIEPTHAKAWYNLGNALHGQDKLDQAVAAYRRALALRPDYAVAHNNLGNTLKDQGLLDEGLACYDRAIRIASATHHAAFHSNRLFLLHFLPDYDAAAILAEHREWNLRHAQPLSKLIQPHLNQRNPDRRLKIAYVSPDFRQHPIGRFLLPLLRCHDRALVEVTCYSDVPDPDEMTQRLRSHADVWRNISGFSDEQLARQVRDDQIDILVDLSVHSAGNRLLAFAQKPAPVQFTYLGYCSTTGMEAIDYRFTDAFFDPPELGDGFYRERSIRLPETYWCYEQPGDAPEPGQPPALARGHITFGCLNNFAKVSPLALAAWCRLLRKVPQSRLVLHAKEGSHRQNVIDLLEREAIAPARVSFVAPMPLDEYFRVYQQIDIGLDSFPCAGGTTTCDALWMGVPMVSLAGRTAVGRAGASILSNVGHPEWVARSEDRYIEVAAELAGDVPRLSNLRLALREQMRTSPLMDAPRFAREIESAYRQTWRQWVAEVGVTSPTR